MSKTTEYRCDLCADVIHKDAAPGGVGVLFVSDGRCLELRHHTDASCNTHICGECLRALAREAVKYWPQEFTDDPTDS